MKTTINVGAAYGTPVAMKNATGEWVEVGYVTDLEFTVHQEESIEFLPLPYRFPRMYSMDLDIQANEDARSLMIEIAQRSMAE